MRLRWHLFKQKRVLVSLLHLPDELLLQVIEDLDEDDLYALSVLCKRLQRICLPTYLLRHGITTPLIFPIDHLIITPPQSYTPGILLAFFAKKVRKLSLDVAPLPLQVSVARAVHRLRRMIITIDGLEDLALHFQPFYSKYWHFNTLYDDHEWDLATEACIHLLEVIAKRCVCLRLSYPHIQAHAWKPFKVELEKEAAEWRSNSPLNNWGRFKERLSLSRSHTLKTLIFRSNTFLLPPFSGWALKILNTTSLTRLDLVEVNLLETDDLSGLVFGALTLPNLKDLRIIACQFEFDALVEFLSRHGTISTFDIISSLQQSPCHWQLPITTFPALVSLKSNPNCIDSLLTPTGAFPNLAHARVVIYSSPDDQFRFDAVENSLARTAKRLSETNVRLCLDILSDFAFGTLLADLSRASVLSHDRYPVLSQVREITFGPEIDAPSPADLLSWLSVFPLLEHIGFSNAQFGLDQQAKMSLVRLLVQTCPRIRSVNIGEDTRDVSAWLRSDND